MTPTETHTVVVEREMPYPAEKVWRALTQQALVKEWLMDNDFQPVAGHKFKFRSQPVQGWDGIIDIRSRHRRTEQEALLYLVYHGDGVGRGLHAGGKQRRHDGAHGALGLPVGKDAAYKGATYGWQKFIGNLERVVAGL